MLTLTLIAVVAIVYNELAAKVKDRQGRQDTGLGNPGFLQAQLNVGGGSSERTGPSSEQDSDQPSEEKNAVYIKVQKDFYASLMSCLEEGRAATVTFNCSNSTEGLPRSEISGRNSPSTRQRENLAATAYAYQQLPVT